MSNLSSVKTEASSEALSEIAKTKITVPEFLTSNYIEDILQNYYNDASLKVKSIKVGPFGNVGDAFASTMYKLETSYSNGRGLKRESFIIKMMPTSQLAREKLGSGNYDVHEKEMKLFQSIFPKLNNILKPIAADKNNFPAAIAVDKVRGVIVLEDLGEKEFLMADRKVGLDLNHLKLALIKLARFHAASMILMRDEPTVLDRSFDVGMFSRKTSAFNEFFSSNLDALTVEVSSWEGFEELTEKLENLKSNMYENAFKVFDNNSGDLKVLVHGDLWVNNLMFQYNADGTPKDSILLDFQFCCVAHPAVDLLYFLYTSSLDDIRQTKILELVQYYFLELKKVLTKLNYDSTNIPTLHQFQIQVLQKHFYAFPSSMLILPLMMSDDPESNFENVHQTNEKALAFKRRLYKNPKLQEIIKNSLPKFLQMGLLDKM